jgi:hypothetical protein
LPDILWGVRLVPDRAIPLQSRQRLGA